MTVVIKDRGKEQERRLEFEPERLERFIKKGLEKIKVNEKTKDEFIKKIIRQVERRKEIDSIQISKLMKENALDLTEDIKDDEGNISEQTLSNSNWEKFARYILQQELYKRASRNRAFDSKLEYGDFFGLITTLTEKGLYTPDLLKNYSRDELIKAGNEIVPERDELFNFAGLYSLAERYLVKDFDGSIFELPQERFMVASLHIMMEETENRMEKVIELYWAISNLYLTLATPTLTNAGRVRGGLSSCFVLTSEDSLRGIYDDNTDIATFSKNGAGIGKLPA